MTVITHFLAITNKLSTIVISIKMFLIIAFASITKINQNRNVSLIIIDNIGSTEVAPKDIIPSFNYKRFCGKVLGKLLLTSIQFVCNVLCKDKDNVVMLKCTNELHLFFESIGFKRVTKKSK